MTSISAKLAPAHRLATWAVAGGICGLLAAIGALPSGLKAGLLLAFVAIGPGSALLEYWTGTLPPVARRALVPVVGLAVVTLVVTVALLLGYWSPRVVLLALAVVTTGLGAMSTVRGRAAR